jgi:hypothetical protein
MNTMYLVCVHHPEAMHALRLGRRNLDGYNIAPTSAKIEKFFAEHKLCGGGFDHFTIAFELAKDHDLPLPKPVADGVHMALREAANEP